MYDHTHLQQTETHFSTKICLNSNKLPSPPHVHTHTNTTPQGGFTECPLRCPTSPLHRAHEIWLSCVHLTSILDKANPNLYAAWQAGTLSNANARDTLEVDTLCGYFYKQGLFCLWSSTGASQLVAVSALASSITPFCFLSLCPHFLLFIKAPQNNKSPRNWEHVMKS